MLAAGVAPAFASDVERDVGLLLGVREYALRAMDYCFNDVASRVEFNDAAQIWRQRNADDSASLDKVYASLNVDASVEAQMDQMIADQIKSDVAGAADATAFCENTASTLVSGRRDMSAMAPDALAVVRAAAGN